MFLRREVPLRVETSFPDIGANQEISSLAERSLRCNTLIVKVVCFSADSAHKTTVR